MWPWWNYSVFVCLPYAHCKENTHLFFNHHIAMLTTRAATRRRGRILSWTRGPTSVAAFFDQPFFCFVYTECNFHSNFMFLGLAGRWEVDLKFKKKKVTKKILKLMIKHFIFLLYFNKFAFLHIILFITFDRARISQKAQCYVHQLIKNFLLGFVQAPQCMWLLWKPILSRLP